LSQAAIVHLFHPNLGHGAFLLLLVSRKVTNGHPTYIQEHAYIKTTLQNVRLLTWNKKAPNVTKQWFGGGGHHNSGMRIRAGLSSTQTIPA
jgi:hypothetical protein